MKKLLILCLIFSYSTLLAQPNTDVFLFDLTANTNTFEISNMLNISNNDGYDNQPSFLNNSIILYAGTRNGQTDIVQYNINYDSKIFINHTEGSEYSPLKIPEQNYVSSIRLEKDGAQKLYKYNLSNGESEVLIEDIIIGYHVWYNEQVLLSSVLEDGGLSLYQSNIKTKSNSKLDANIGRSLHKIPNTNLISYISKKDENLWEIRSVNPKNGETKSIVGTLPKSEDMCWLSNGTILMGNENALYTFRPGHDVDWNEVTSLETYNIKNISRLAVSPDGKKLVVVGETATTSTENSSETKPSGTTSSNTETSEVERIVQIQLDAYNARDIDAFMATYSKDIKLYNYPNELQTNGQDQMRKVYKDWFDSTPDLRAFIKNRIVIGNRVIDDEQVTANGQVFNAVAIYEVENGLITKVTFIR